MSVGVGRGRGRLPQQVNGDVEPLRRPNIVAVGRGRSLPVQGQSLSKCKFMDVELSVSDPNVESTVLFKALDDFLSTNPSEEDMQELVKKIFDVVLKGKTNTDCICKCIYLASKHKTKGESIHMILFTQLEQKFTGLELIKENNGMSGLWRFQLLFSSVGHFVRNQRVAPFDDLIDGLKKLCLECVQPNNSEEAKIAALSIARCVYYMKMVNKPQTQTDTLMSKLRGLLHAAGSAAASDSNVLLWFGLGLETSCHVGAKLPDETMQYYCKLLGPEAAMFNMVPPALNLPRQAQPNYNFSDISYILNFI